MARFYVGQRVRLVRPSRPGNYGNVGTIVCFAEWPAGTFCVKSMACTTIDTNCSVLWDYKAATTGVPNLQHTDQLEPLTDPGREVVSWETCAWKPEHLRDKA